MIEKFELQRKERTYPEYESVLDKINELVDAINEMQSPGQGPEERETKQQVDGSDKEKWTEVARIAPDLERLVNRMVASASTDAFHAGIAKGVEDALLELNNHVLLAASIKKSIRERLLK